MGRFGVTYISVNGGEKQDTAYDITLYIGDSVEITGKAYETSIVSWEARGLLEGSGQVSVDANDDFIITDTVSSPWEITKCEGEQHYALWAGEVSGTEDQLISGDICPEEEEECAFSSVQEVTDDFCGWLDSHPSPSDTEISNKSSYYVDQYHACSGDIKDKLETYVTELTDLYFSDDRAGKVSDLINQYCTPAGPAISVTDVWVYTDSTPVTSWEEDQPFRVDIDVINDGEDGSADIEITYNGQLIDSFNTGLVLSGVPTGFSREQSAGTIPPGTWDFCVKVVTQYLE